MSSQNSETTSRAWSVQESDESQYATFGRRLFTRDARRLVESTNIFRRPPFPKFEDSSSVSEMSYTIEETGEESDDTQYLKFERRLLTQDANRFLESSAIISNRPDSFSVSEMSNTIEVSDFEVSREFEVLSLESDEKVPQMLHDCDDAFLATRVREEKKKVQKKDAGNHTQKKSTSVAHGASLNNSVNTKKQSEKKRMAALDRYMIREYGLLAVLNGIRSCKVGKYKSVGVQTMLSPINLNGENCIYTSNKRSIDALCLEVPKTKDYVVKPFCACKASEDILLRTDMTKKKGSLKYGGQAEKPPVRVDLSRRRKFEPLRKTVGYSIMMSSRNASK